MKTTLLATSLAAACTCAHAGESDAPAAATPTASSASGVDPAVAARRAADTAKLDEAEAMYRRCLQIDAGDRKARRAPAAQ